MLSRTPLRATLAAGATAGLLLTGGVAAAATGALPGAAQDTAQQMLDRVGVTVPGADEASAGHADERGDSTTEVATTEEHGPVVSTRESTEEPTSSDKGTQISELARTTEATGVDKGAEISTLASDGHSQAGQHGSATAPEEPARPTTGQPDEAGQPAAPDAAGQEEAAEASAGSSTGGVQHRP